MAWAGGTWDNTGTSTGSIGMGIQVHYDKTFLSRTSENLFMHQFAQTRSIPKGGGTSIRFFRYHKIANITSKLTEGTNPDPTAITGCEVNRTLEEWGAFSQQSSFISRTHIDKGMSDLAGLWGDNAGSSIDLRTMKEVVTNGCHTIRADNTNTGGIAAGVKSLTIGTTTACSTTVIYSATAALTDDAFNGGHLTFTSGENYGQSRYISDSASAAAESSQTVVLPFENAAAAGDTYYVSHPGRSNMTTLAADAMDTTDVITYKTIIKAWERLKSEKAMPYSGGFYTLILGPTTHAGFLSDGTWIGLQQYQPKEKSNLKNGEIGRFGSFKVVTTTQPFRATLPVTATTGGPGQTDTTYETAGVNYSETGTAHYSLAFGKEAFGVSNFSGWKTPKIIIKNPGPSDTGNPLNRFSTAGWELTYVPVALNALWCVGIVSGA